VTFKYTAKAIMLAGAIALATGCLFNTAAASPRTSKVSHNYTWLPGHPPKVSHPRLPPKAIKVQHNYPHDPRYGPH
jgi:hypothetical protein